MAIKYVPYFKDTIEGQAILDNFTRTKRILKYAENNKVYENIKRGLPLYEMETKEIVGEKSNNLVIRGECLSACAYLKEKDIKVDLVYIDPPFASGADYAKTIYIRRNPKVGDAIKKAEETLDIEELKTFEEKMYGDIWTKEAYLNWMYENLMAIKSVMSEKATIYVHLDHHIGHYVKILLDEIFGEDRFLNEIIWCYKTFGVSTSNFARKHDSIYVYTKSQDYIFNVLKEKSYNRGMKKYGFKQGKYPVLEYEDEQGWYTLVNMKDWWTDINPIFKDSADKMDYSTQKPEALLERIIKASSKEGMIVADFFGGSGVTAKVANDLGRQFIHCDVGINSIETTRDRLFSAKASFQVLDIKDGVNLYRNPIQTMDKITSLIPGLKKEASLSSFWAGAMNDSKLGIIPVYLPNLLDSFTKVLNIPLINRIVNSAIPELSDNIKKIIIYYVDIIEKKEINNFIKDYLKRDIEIELRDLKQILDETILSDIVDYEIKKDHILINHFVSDRLMQKIKEYNEKMTSQPKNNKKVKAVQISENGLELIELISLDCTTKEGVWHSDEEIKIDKFGYVIENGEKTKRFWDGTIKFKNKPHRMKIRNICGDESVFELKTQK